MHHVKHTFNLGEVQAAQLAQLHHEELLAAATKKPPKQEEETTETHVIETRPGHDRADAEQEEMSEPEGKKQQENETAALQGDDTTPGGSQENL